jgi:hypothetical protein
MKGVPKTYSDHFVFRIQSSRNQVGGKFSKALRSRVMWATPCEHPTASATRSILSQLSVRITASTWLGHMSQFQPSDPSCHCFPVLKVPVLTSQYSLNSRAWQTILAVLRKHVFMHIFAGSPFNHKQHTTTCWSITAHSRRSVAIFTHSTHAMHPCAMDLRCENTLECAAIYSCKIITFFCVSIALHSFAIYLQIHFRRRIVKILVSLSQKQLRLPERCTEHVFQFFF